MEGWAEIWDIPEIVFPLRMARTREEFDQLALLDFEVEVRGPDSVKLDDCSIELCDDLHEIYFRAKQSGFHHVRIKVHGEDFCAPICLYVKEDGSVKAVKPRGNSKDKRPRPEAGHHRWRHDNRHDSKTAEIEEAQRLRPSLSSRSSESSQSSVQSGRNVDSVNYISGKDGQLFVESNGRLLPVQNTHGQLPERADGVGLMRSSAETGKKLISGSRQASKTAKKSTDKQGLYNCTHCNKLIKLKKLLLLDRKTFCESCFKSLFMRKGPEQHLEALQPPERDQGQSKRNSLILSRFSQHPRANLTGLKLKHIKHAQTEFSTFDSHATGKADRRFLEPLLRACLAQHLSERKTNEAMGHPNTRQAIIRCGLYGPGEMTALQFLNILAFTMRERTTKWLAKSATSKMKRSPLSEPNLTNLPNEMDMFRDGAGSESKIRARMVGTLETIPSADDLSSMSDEIQLPEPESADSKAPKTEVSESPILPVPEATQTKLGPPVPGHTQTNLGLPVPEPTQTNLGSPPTAQEREFGITHGDSDAWMMY